MANFYCQKFGEGKEKFNSQLLHCIHSLHLYLFHVGWCDKPRLPCVMEFRDFGGLPEKSSSTSTCSSFARLRTGIIFFPIMLVFRNNTDTFDISSYYNVRNTHYNSSHVNTTVTTYIATIPRKTE